eukprot:5382998-Amphidinium_carterae.1
MLPRMYKRSACVKVVANSRLPSEPQYVLSSSRCTWYVTAGISATRVGSGAQQDQMKMVAGRLKLTLAQFVELEAFSEFGKIAADLGDDTRT